MRAPPAREDAARVTLALALARRAVDHLADGVGSAFDAESMPVRVAED
ncbi:hypothetical protein [Haloplanus halophilus]|nr:hypothetical protein [Haloplanus sp. GDY1]